MCMCVCVHVTFWYTHCRELVFNTQSTRVVVSGQTLCMFSALSFCFAERSAFCNLCKSYPLFIIVIVTWFEFVEAGCVNGSGEEEVSFISAAKSGPV